MTPDGFVYVPELIERDEENKLLERFERLDFQEIRMRGQVARRTAIHYGMDYDYNAPSRVLDAQPLPDWLEPTREKCAALAGVQAVELVEAIVQRYPPGATIGWHRDAPQFGRVAGVSLGAACRLRLRRVSDHSETAEQELEPRSGYLFRGSARWQWQHSIPPTKELRYSITFRTLRAASH
jgi:alkylated DNA repair protein (DNA oxidative demethylase)